MYSTCKNAVTKTVEVEGVPFAYREVGPATGSSPAGLTNVGRPVLVVNGDEGIFRHHDLFVAQALEFLH